MKSRKLLVVTSLISAVVLLIACQQDPNIFSGINTSYKLDIGIFPTPDLPKDNPLTREGVKLGRMLFYEKMLSRDGTQSCASCHNQANAFSDTNRFSIGIKNLPGDRQAMSVVNMAWNSGGFFWDGRADILRHQSLKPIENPVEMDDKLNNVVAKLQASSIYRKQFNLAFGTEIIDTILMSKAMEQFMNSITSMNSKYDYYLAGKAILSAEEERGRYLFFTEYNPAFPTTSGADCQHCHGGLNFENDKYMNNGIDDDAGITDIGRELVTGDPAHKAKFKVPTLRNIELTHPYMHDGRFKTLEEVVEHYNMVKTSSTLNLEFNQQVLNGGLKLTVSDKAALVAFLKTLTDHTLATNEAYSSPF